jgi:hypothetical protein
MPFIAWITAPGREVEEMMPKAVLICAQTSEPESTLASMRAGEATGMVVDAPHTALLPADWAIAARVDSHAPTNIRAMANAFLRIGTTGILM